MPHSSLSMLPPKEYLYFHSTPKKKKKATRDVLGSGSLHIFAEIGPRLGPRKTDECIW